MFTSGDTVLQSPRHQPPGKLEVPLIAEKLFFVLLQTQLPGSGSCLWMPFQTSGPVHRWQVGDSQLCGNREIWSLTHFSFSYFRTRYYRSYSPYAGYPADSRLLWRIEYVLSSGALIPSPVWGFQTRAFPDFKVEQVLAPPNAFSSQTFEVSWTVRNIGKVGNLLVTWVDAVFIGKSTDFRRARWCHNFAELERIVYLRGILIYDTRDCSLEHFKTVTLKICTWQLRRLAVTDLCKIENNWHAPCEKYSKSTSAWIILKVARPSTFVGTLSTFEYR